MQSLIHLSQEPIRPASGLQNSIISMGWDPELYHPLALTLLLIKCCADFYYNGDEIEGQSFVSDPFQNAKMET